MNLRSWEAVSSCLLYTSDNQTQVQVQTEGTPSQAQEPLNFENVTKKLEQIQDIIDKKYLFEEKIDTSEEEALSLIHIYLEIEKNPCRRL